MAGSTCALQSKKFPLVSFSLIGAARREGTVVVDGVGDDEVIVEPSTDFFLEIGCLRG
jgi:hypothetical protein